MHFRRGLNQQERVFTVQMQKLDATPETGWYQFHLAGNDRVQQVNKGREHNFVRTERLPPNVERFKTTHIKTHAHTQQSIFLRTKSSIIWSDLKLISVLPSPQDVLTFFHNSQKYIQSEVEQEPPLN